MSIVTVRYYNIWFSLLFREGNDELKKQCLMNMIESTEGLRMRTIYEWCQRHEIPVFMKFSYCSDFSFVTNLWNLYSYCRFWLEITIFK